MGEILKTISLKHGEKKVLKFVYTSDGDPLSIEAATLTLTIKKNITDTSAALSIADGSFTKAVNIARANLDTSSLDMEWVYVGEIKAVFGSTSHDKSETFFLKISRSVDGG